MLLLNDYDAVIIGHSQLLKYINMLLLNRKVFFKNERFSRVKIHQYVTVKPSSSIQSEERYGVKIHQYVTVKHFDRMMDELDESC